jgi:folate-binding protein YgfZ
MDADLIAKGEAVFAPLSQFGALSVTGIDARAFLHAQLSNDIEHLPADAARRAGYCSAKGRMLASFLVVPRPDGFLLQVSRDIAAAIAKRLTMYVLRSKVKVSDAGDAWAQFGVWGRDAAARLRSAGFDVPANAMEATATQDRSVVAPGDGRFLVFGPPETATLLAAGFSQVAPDWWTLADVRAGLPQVTLATQDQFVPQMANFELVGGVDFKKGCYPGQEIVARSQYLGKLKRRMYRGTLDAAPSMPAPGQDLFAGEPQAIGTIVSAAPRPEGGYEFLAVMQSSAVEGSTAGDGAIRLGAPDGPIARMASLPYAV